MMVPDFYVWCCGLGYDARLFDEFKAEAALVIRDKDAFRARLSAAVAGELPEGSVTDGPLTYYDPYTARHEQLVPIFSKHFRYLYQNEYRFAWTIPEGEPLESFFVELGPLHVSDTSSFARCECTKNLRRNRFARYKACLS
jgi:hypothetical protein